MKPIVKILWITAALLATACIDGPEKDRVAEGEPAVIKFSLRRDDAVTVSTKGLTTSEEETLYNICFLVFDSDGNISTRVKFSDLNDDLLVFPAFSGGNMDIYAVANYYRFESKLDAVTTKAGLLAVTAGRGIDEEDHGKNFIFPEYLAYVGSLEDVTITAGTTYASPQALTMNLSNISAKITIKVVDNTTDQNVTLLGWKIHNLPVKTRLFEGTSDAMQSDSDYYSYQEAFSWEDYSILNHNKSVSESFYMWENRKGTSSSTSYDQKTQYAPANCTYVSLFFNVYNTTVDSTYSIRECRLNLGENDYNDYNVRRGHHYRWTMDIQGINSITVNVSDDSNVSDSESYPIVIIPSTLLTMDSHPSIRNFLVSGDPDKIGDLSVEILDGSSRSYDQAGFDADWLKVSPLNLGRSQIRQATDTAFQQSGTTGSFVRGRHIPHKSIRAVAGVNTSWLADNGISFSSTGTGDGRGGNLVLPDDDDCLPFSEATYRMCYKITDLPFDSATGDHLYSVYADEFEYTDGKTLRHGYVRFSFRDSAKHETRNIVYRIAQKQALYIGKVVESFNNDGTKDYTAEDVRNRTVMKDILIEQIEETSMWLYPEVSSGRQFTNTMQWGYYGSLLYDPATLGDDPYEKYRNGYFLTANTVYDNVTKNADGSASWSDGNAYRTKYGRAAGSVIAEPYAGTASAPYYYASTYADDVFDPTYEVSAARYCHEKNHDINGDGTLSPSETRWYLPSQHEICQIWVSMEALRNTTSEYGYGNYWSSSEYDANSAYMFGFSSAFAKAPRNKNNNNNEGINNNDSVRCVRRK